MRPPAVSALQPFGASRLCSAGAIRRLSHRATPAAIRFHSRLVADRTSGCFSGRKVPLLTAGKCTDDVSCNFNWRKKQNYAPTIVSVGSIFQIFFQSAKSNNHPPSKLSSYFLACAVSLGVCFPNRAFTAPPAENFHNLSASDIDGNNIDFEKYKGKVVLVVNVASRWGQKRKHTHYGGISRAHECLRAHSTSDALWFPFPGLTDVNYKQLQSIHVEYEKQVFFSHRNVMFPHFHRDRTSDCQTHRD